MKHRLCLREPVNPSTPESGHRLNLAADQAHYLGRVLRLRTGAAVRIFDGRGREWQAEIDQIDGKRATLLLGPLIRDEAPPAPLILAQAWLKGSALDAVVQKSVELGATGIWLVDAERSNVKADPKRRENKLTHLSRVIQSAAEQCETVWLPELTAAGTLGDVVAVRRPGRTLFLDPGGRPLASEGPEPLTLLIGPEGGWSEAERALIHAEDSVETVGLGSLIVRAETAPLAVLAAVRQAWSWSR